MCDLLSLFRSYFLLKLRRVRFEGRVRVYVYLKEGCRLGKGLRIRVLIYVTVRFAI